MDAHLLPQEELLLANGAALGQALAENGKDAKVKAYTRSLRRRAYPEELVRWPSDPS